MPLDSKAIDIAINGVNEHITSAGGRIIEIEKISKRWTSLAHSLAYSLTHAYSLTLTHSRLLTHTYSLTPSSCSGVDTKTCKYHPCDYIYSEFEAGKAVKSINISAEGEPKIEPANAIFTDFLSRETYSENIMLKVLTHSPMLTHSLTHSCLLTHSLTHSCLLTHSLVKSYYTVTSNKNASIIPATMN